MDEKSSLPVPDNKVADNLNLPISIAAQVMIRGVIAGAGNAPLEVTMRTIAYHVGYGMASMIQGDLPALIGVRKSIQEAFKEGVGKAPLTFPKPPPGFDPVAKGKPS